MNLYLQRQGGYTVHRPSGSGPSIYSSTYRVPGSASSQARDLLAGASQKLYGDIFQMSPLGLSEDEELHLAPENMSLNNVVNGLPISECCEELIRAYLRGYHTVKPLFDSKSFLRETRKLASW